MNKFLLISWILFILNTVKALVPDFWNKLDLKTSGFYLYYGWIQSTNQIFFQFSGLNTNGGWIGLAFGPDMYNADFITLQQQLGVVGPVDRYSVQEGVLANADTSQQVSCDPGCPAGTVNAAYVWSNVIITRMGTSVDSLYDTLIDDSPRTITFFRGSTATYSLAALVDQYTVTFAKYPICDGLCETGKCFGPENYQCLECADPNHVTVFNYLPPPPSTMTQELTTSECIPRKPAFWNKIDITQFGQAIYWGFDIKDTVPLLGPSAAKYIYFQFTGTHQGYQGIGFQYPVDPSPTNQIHTDKDMIIVRKQNGKILIEDRYSSTVPLYNQFSNNYNTMNHDQRTSILSNIPELLTDSQENDVRYCSGDRDINNNWDVVVVRRLDTNEQSTADPLVKTKVDFVFVPNDPNHPVYMSYAYHEENQKLDQWHCKNLVSPNPTPSTQGCAAGDRTRVLIPIIFTSYQICHANCDTEPSATLSPGCPVGTSNSFPWCVGPENNQCTRCQPNFELKNGICPGECVPIILQCHVDCETCGGRHNNDCKTCQSPLLKILYRQPKGRCIPVKPVFWNQINMDRDALYYGYDSSNQYIYFRIVTATSETTNVGWVGVGFGKDHGSATQRVDMFQVYMSGDQAKVRDVYTPGTTLPYAQDDPSTPNNQQHLVVTGGKKASNIWDVTVVREVDPRYPDSFTPTNTLGIQDEFDTIIDDQFRFLMYAQSDKEDPQEKHTVTIIKENQRFMQSQVCNSLCRTCSGPQEYDCMSCIPNYALFGSPPAPCYQIYTTNCSPQCATCQLFTSVSLCLTCISSVSVLHKGYCIPQTPLFTNKLYYPVSNFYIYYGYDSFTNPTYIYFRVKGTNNGWLGLGFGPDMNGVDTVSIRKKDGIVLVEDRWAQGNFPPEVDTNFLPAGSSDFTYIEGNRADGGEWDVSFVRNVQLEGNTDRNIDPSDITLSLALGTGDSFDRHDSVEKQIISFSQKQICDSTCNNYCVSPEPDSCIACQIGSDLQGTAPSQCVVQYNKCHIVCKTCTGPSSLECLQCASDDLVAIQGECVLKSPKFWNQVEIPQTSLQLYYGYGEDDKYIYFKVIGKSQNPGWIGMGFGNNMTKTDMILIRQNKDTNKTLVQDRYSTYKDRAPILDTDNQGQRDVYYCYGGRVDTDWNITFMRPIKSNDVNDISLVPDQQNVTFAFGKNDDFAQHANYSISEVEFVPQQVCDPLCSSCAGPEVTDCLSCLQGYKLSGEAPSECIQQKIKCHIDCATCTGPEASDCQSCSSTSKIAYQGSCIEKTPSFWNQVTVNNQFNLYYGYDSQSKYLYFNFKGLSTGWIGMGFGETMTNTDMIIVYKQQDKVIVTDRYSIGHNQPSIDAQQDVIYVSGDRDALNIWDVIVVRALNTRDSMKDLILDIQPRPLIFAFGETDYFAKHSQSLVLTKQQFFNSIVCTKNCAVCKGPQDADCTQFVTVSANKQNQSTILTSVSILIICLLIMSF